MAMVEAAPVPVPPGMETALMQMLGPFGVLVVVLLLGALALVLKLAPRLRVDPRQAGYHEENKQLIQGVQKNQAENRGLLERIEEEVRGGLRRVEEQLLRLNGRMGKLEEWRDSHNKQDDERHAHNDTEHRDVWEEIRRVREHVHDTRGEMQKLVLRTATTKPSGGSG